MFRMKSEIKRGRETARGREKGGKRMDEWAWWQLAVFLSLSSAVTLFGYIVGCTATKRARRGDED